jgi:hypothetical protein
MIISSFESVNVSAMAPDSLESEDAANACQSFKNCLADTCWNDLPFGDRYNVTELAMHTFFATLRLSAELADGYGLDTFPLLVGEDNWVDIKRCGAETLVLKCPVALWMLLNSLPEGDDYYESFVAFALQSSLADEISEDDASAVIDGFKFLLVELLNRFPN